MPDPVTGTIAAVATVGSSVIGSKAAKSAAQTQADAADRAMAQELAMYEQSREDLGPYRELGYTALGDIESRIPYFTSQFGDEQLRQYLDPSMAFRQRLGTQATERLANVGGGALSGNTMRALNEFGQNLASTEYGNAFNRFQTERGNIYNTLANIAGMGQGAVNTGVQAGQNFAAQQTGLLTGQAAALAGGQVGSANAIAGGLGQLGNLAMYYGMNQPAVTPPPGYGTTGAPGMGGGSGLTYSPATANKFFSAG